MASPRVRFEACVENAAEAIAAGAGGADRVELCARLDLDGLTPAITDVRAARRALRIPIMTMLRPRAGDFVYDAAEFAAMLADIDRLREAGADGIVAGVLLSDGAVDAARLGALVARARPMPLTFHRAFDEAPDPSAALETLIAAGASAVLTAGGRGSAPAGAEALRTLVRQARGRIEVIAGGGVRAPNVAVLVEAAGVPVVHGTCGYRGSQADASRVDSLRQRVSELVAALTPTARS